MRNKLLFTLSLVFLVFFISCSNTKYRNIIWLDEIPYGSIFNKYGLPSKNLTFSKNEITLNGIKYNRGLGTPAPSDLSVFIGGYPVIFEAVIGNYTPPENYADGHNSSYIHSINKSPEISKAASELLNTENISIVYKIFADRDLVYQSEPMNRKSRNRKIRIKTKTIQTLRLVTEASEPVNLPVNASWAMAHLRFEENMHAASFQIYSYPKTILFNQAGYKPGSYKTCLIPIENIDSLYIEESKTNIIVFRKTIDVVAGDFGRYLVADFTEFREPGEYYLISSGMRTGIFSIREELLRNLAEDHLYFIQDYRISQLSFSPDNEGKSIPKSNSGHITNNSDSAGSETATRLCLKEYYSILQTLHALIVYYENCPDGEAKEKIPEEIIAYNNLLTETGKSLLKKNLSASQSVVKQQNPLYFINDPEEIKARFTYSICQSKISGLLIPEEKINALACIELATEYFMETEKNVDSMDAYCLGAAVAAASELYTATGKPVYKYKAEEIVNKLIKLSVHGNTNPSNYFQASGTGKNLAISTLYGEPDWPLTGLCIYLSTFSSNKNSEACMNTLSGYCDNYISYFAGKTPFRVLPLALYNENPGNLRQSTGLYYRYFPNTDNDFWKGTNADIASKGIGILMAYSILNKPHLLKIAQKQLDWIYGSNPFGISMVKNRGENDPFLFEEGLKHNIKGSVISGLSGGESDAPRLYPAEPEDSDAILTNVANTLLLTIMLEKAVLAGAN